MFTCTGQLLLGTGITAVPTLNVSVDTSGICVTPSVEELGTIHKKVCMYMSIITGNNWELEELRVADSQRQC